MKYLQDVLEAYLNIINKYKDHEDVKRRIANNIENEDKQVSREKFWRALLLGVITSGRKESEVEKIKALPIFDLEAVSQEKDLQTFFASQLCCLGCQNRFSEYLSDNYERMNRTWDKLQQQLATLQENISVAKERQTANCLQDFKGIGPKQSRNMLQMLGLSRYVIPIDSRISRALRELGGMDMLENKMNLSNEKTYRQIEDQVIDLCKELEIEPCVLEACLYRAFE